MKGAKPPSHKSYHQQVLQNQLDAAAAYEAQRRREISGGTSDSNDLWKNLAGLLFGLIAIGFVIFMAWNAGLFR